MDDFKKALAEVTRICNEYDFKQEYAQSLAVEEAMVKFRVKVMFTGSFSAGKSAAINSILRDGILTENLTPETAIAAELMYDSEDYIEAVKADDETERFDIASSGNIDPNKFEYLIYHLNNSHLKEISRFTIVDMPGYNSGISNHNKAILRYAGKGNAYILVIDCEDGEIKESFCSFMEEIRNYDNNVAVALSKTDKKTPAALQPISENILSSAQMIFGSDVKLVNVSKYDEGSGSRLIGLINSFDSNDIYSQTFKPQITELCTKCICGLSGLKKGLTLNESEINKEIFTRENNMEALEKQLENEKKKLSNSMKNDVLPRILNDAQNALLSNADSLTSALMNGGSTFSTSVNNILRSVLATSTRGYMERSFSEFACNLDLNQISNDVIKYNLDTDRIKGKMNEAQNAAGRLASNDKMGGAVYKAVVGALSIVTNVVAPWLEIVIFFLPDVIKLFAGSSEKQQEQRAEEEARYKLANEIIPQIISRLSPEIESSLENMKNAMVDDVSTSLNESIKIEIEGLKDAKARLEANRKSFDEDLQKIDRDIMTLNGFISRL